MFIFNIIRMLFIIRKNKIDIVHINNDIYSGIFAIIAAKMLKKKIVCIIRAYFTPNNSEIYFLKFIDKVILLNKQSLNLYIQWAKSENQMCIIYDGIDRSKYIDKKSLKENVTREFTLSPEELVVGSVGRLVKGKGFEDFLEAASIVLKKKNNIKFFIVGSSAESESNYELKLHTLVQKYNIQKNVIFTGWRNDVAKLINRFDVCVQASSSPEGLGTTLIEASALSKPIVATKVSGFEEIVEAGKTGILVPPHNPYKLAESILTLLENKQLATKMGEAAYMRFLNNFEAVKMTKKLERIYREVFGVKRKNP